MTRIFLFLAVPLHFAWAGESVIAWAHLVEWEVDGTEIESNITLEMNSSTAADADPVSFTLIETIGGSVCDGSLCSMAPSQLHKTYLKVDKSVSLPCGSRKYLAREQFRRGRPGRKLWLFDHSRRWCDDYRKWVWTAKLISAKGSIRYFSGNPTSVNTGTDCKQSYAKRMCTMIYAPASCMLVNYRGEPISLNLQAAGGNACQAEGELFIAACERGLDPEKLVAGDVVCASALCPMPVCADPPGGCVYRSETYATGCENPCAKLECPPAG